MIAVLTSQLLRLSKTPMLIAGTAEISVISTTSVLVTMISVILITKKQCCYCTVFLILVVRLHLEHLKITNNSTENTHSLYSVFCRCNHACCYCTVFLILVVRLHLEHLKITNNSTENTHSPDEIGLATPTGITRPGQLGIIEFLYSTCDVFFSISGFCTYCSGQFPFQSNIWENYNFFQQNLTFSPVVQVVALLHLALATGPTSSACSAGGGAEARGGFLRLVNVLNLPDNCDFFKLFISVAEEFECKRPSLSVSNIKVRPRLGAMWVCETDEPSSLLVSSAGLRSLGKSRRHGKDERQLRKNAINELPSPKLSSARFPTFDVLISKFH
uniref:Uncharacterized protein n=1 Tax=Glossina brevipalpis TaxID=37001 RepID=A0A1A9WYJ0_9MUSC